MRCDTAAVLLLGLAACAAQSADAPEPFTTTTTTTTVPPTTETVPATTTTTVDVTSDPTLPRVAPEGSRAGYDRDLFGSYDRQALLAASLAEYGCYYSLPDDVCYSDPSRVEVDHIVALAEAWDSGASGWDPVQLGAFGGDEANLELLTSELNRAKGDDDPAEWLPPSPGAVCEYLDRYVEVKRAWDLTVDAAELAALERSDCG